MGHGAFVDGVQWTEFLGLVHSGWKMGKNTPPKDLFSSEALVVHK
jgi:hypothetical protein